MVMDRINGMSNLGKGFLERFNRTDRAGDQEGKSPAETGASRPEAGLQPGDRAEISPKAHRLMALRNAMDSGRQALADLPEVRQDRVSEVRSRLDRGFYNSLEVRSRVAERLGDVARNLEDL
jgi:hypothetical protein